MNNKITFCCAGILSTCLLIAGCGRKPYDHKKYSAGSAEFQHVQSMINALRKSTPNKAAKKYGVDDISQERRELLLCCLESIKNTETVDLMSVDSFGPKVYRAAMCLRNPHGKKNLTMLLLKCEDDQLRWLGPN